MAGPARRQGPRRPSRTDAGFVARGRVTTGDELTFDMTWTTGHGRRLP